MNKSLLTTVLLSIVVGIILTLIVCTALKAEEISAVRIVPTDVGIFVQNNTQKFTALGYNGSKWVDISSQVDWYIEENGLPGQPDDVMSVDQEGNVTGIESWGRANVSFCYPKKCKIAGSYPPPVDAPVDGCLPSVYYLLFGRGNPEGKLLSIPDRCSYLIFFGRTEDPDTPPENEIMSASTTATMVNVVSWRAPLPGDKLLPKMPVETDITSTSITESRITWTWKNGFDGLLWAIYSNDGNMTYSAWGWDYVTKNHTLKNLEGGYPRGWVGTAIASCQNCNGYPQRTTINFTETY